MNVAMLPCPAPREMMGGRHEVAKTQYNGCTDVAVAWFWEGVWARNLVFFPDKVAPAGDGRYLGCATGAAGDVLTMFGSSSVFCNEWCVMRK